MNPPFLDDTIILHYMLKIVNRKYKKSPQPNGLGALNEI